jgi:hypothetical protein
MTPIVIPSLMLVRHWAQTMIPSSELTPSPAAGIRTPATDLATALVLCWPVSASNRLPLTIIWLHSMILWRLPPAQLGGTEECAGLAVSSG